MPEMRKRGRSSEVCRRRRRRGLGRRLKGGRDALDIAHYSFDSLAPGCSHWKCIRRAHPYFANRRFDCIALEFAIRAAGSEKEPENRIPSLFRFWRVNANAMG